MFALLASVVAANAKVVYVNGNLITDPVPDGLSWATAFSSVQEGIDLAASGDEVWVAADTYYENLLLKNGVALYGGFAGNESNLNQRNWTTHVTTLDGRQTNSVVTVETGAASTTRIDGFTIQNGRAQNGGGIHFQNASPIIVHNRIIFNSSTSVGGGVEWYRGSPEVAYNLIQANTSKTGGGGLEFSDSSASVHHNRIVGNSVTEGTGNRGGGVLFGGTGSPTIVNNLILGNSTPGGVFSGGAGIVEFFGSEPSLIANNTLLWNQGGSTIVRQGGMATIVNNLIAFGSSGIYATNDAGISHNCVYGNGTADYAGGITNLSGFRGNISLDPKLLADPKYPQFHLSSDSPCRDAGDNQPAQQITEDIDGEPRVSGTAIDIGADEFSNSPPPLLPVIVRCSPSGDDANDGSSWSSATRTVQRAIDLATLTGGEVWVSSGVYTQLITLRLSVYLLGGFAGTETSREQRDWKTNPAVLDGNSAGTVVTASRLQGWCSIDGFVIRNGSAPVGGGINCNRSWPLIANNSIIDNRATNQNGGTGGGIYCSGGSPRITNNVVRSNRAAVGGGIFLTLSSAVVANNRIEGNVAARGQIGFGVGPNGGGGAFVDASGSPVFLNNLFLENVATNAPNASGWGSGGGICGGAGASPVIIGNTFLRNLASSPSPFSGENGGAIYTYYSSLIIVNNLIAFGSSGIACGNTNSAGNIRNNCVFGNTTNYLVLPDITGIDGNISVDPLLVSSNDFHLAAGSPCINAGDDSIIEPGSTDLDGQARKAGAHVDIGADEFGSSLPSTLSLLAGTASNERVLRLAGEPGQTYIVERGSEFTDWLPVSTNAAPTGIIDLPVTVAEGPVHFYFRARTPAP